MSAVPKIELVHEDGHPKGGFYLRQNGETLAEMTYSKAGDTKLLFDHTWVDDSLRGQGRGRELLDAAIVWVRATGHTVVPVCPYVTSQFQKDTSLHDVLA